MMDRSIWRLVILVSLAHSMVHVYELSLTGVEQDIAAEFFPEDPERGKEMTGMLATGWRLPFGFGALLAGWLVDRFGARRLLAIYLLGCSLCCLAVWHSEQLAILSFAMFSMGAFASIYHPAGLALISLSTTPANRAHALGTHGIFGSLGISAAPFIVGLFLLFGFGWRTYYLALALPGLLLAADSLVTVGHRDGQDSGQRARHQTDSRKPDPALVRARRPHRWLCEAC